LQIAYLGAIVEALDYERAGDQKMYEYWFDTASAVGQKAVKKKCSWARG
jgi:hypothetical protein